MFVNNDNSLTSGSSFNTDLKPKCEKFENNLPLTARKQSKIQISSMAEEYEAESVQHASLTNLPNEIFVKIFDQVSFDDLFNLEQVNKRLQVIMLSVVWPTNHTLNHETIIKNTNYPMISSDDLTYRHGKKQHNLINKSLEAIFSRAKIQHLDLRVYAESFKQPFCSLLSMTPQLKTLNVSYIELEKTNLLNIANFCPLLEEISLEHSLNFKAYGESSGMEQGLKNILIHCLNIKYLNISSNFYLNGTNFFNFLPSQLKYLNISGCTSLTFGAMNLIAENAKNLETLILDDIDNWLSNLNNWLNNFSKLKFLQISDMREEGRRKFIDFSKFKELEVLSLHDENYVNIQTLETLQHCPKLKSLNLNFENKSDSEISDVLDILKSFKSLRYCDFHRCQNLDKVIEVVQHCQLEYLSISYFRTKFFDEGIIRILITECLSLTHLQLRSIPGFNNELIASILKEDCPLRKNNILKLVINKRRDNDKIICLPSSKWCKVFVIKQLDRSPFRAFTNVKSQYHLQKSEH